MKLELQKGSRSKILAGLVLGTMAIFAFRLFYLQIIQHDYYVQLADKEQVKRLTIPAKRGVIYALDGSNPVPLAMNQTIYTVFADPKITEKDSKIVDVIKRVAGGNAKPNLAQLLAKKNTRYQVLATQITRTQAELIKKEKLDGIGFQESTKRVYPEGALASQVLDFVDFDGIGRYGVEEKLDARLLGKNGILQSVTDVSDVPLTIGKSNVNIPAVNGDNLVLSIDRNIQSHAEQAMAEGLKRTGATRGNMIIMDPQTGRVLAMANLPTYNPTDYNKVEDAALFNNGTVSAPYEPGSDVKTFTMATGIDKGVVSPSSTYINHDYLRVDDRVIQNFILGFEGVTMTFQEALNYSHNVGFVTVAMRLGDGSSVNRQARDAMYDYFTNKFRLGKITGVEVANEAKGTVIPPTETEGNAVRYSNMAFGQGMDVTMVQVAAAFSSLVNGGKYYKPTVVAGVVDSKGKYVADKVAKPKNYIKSATADQMRQMIHTTRQSLFGYKDKVGYYTGGKTGTSQALKDGAYTFDETIGTYLGFGGSENESKYVIMLQVSADNKGLNGAIDAEPIFTDMSNWMLDYLKIKPKG